MVWWIDVPRDSANSVQRLDVNVDPLSVVISSGMPCAPIQVRRPLAHDAAVASFRGMASGHLVVRSMMVRR